LNSSIENVVDLCSPDIHPLAKKAKDMGSAAQMIASGVLVITWSSLLWELYFR
jgi:Diacylglycerol kinase